MTHNTYTKVNNFLIALALLVKKRIMHNIQQKLSGIFLTVSVKYIVFKIK